jgi:hypothetical protein
MEYESVTQKVLFPSESILHDANNFNMLALYFVVSGLKITGH